MDKPRLSARQKERALKQWLDGGKTPEQVSLIWGIHERTLWTWKSKYDGTPQSLENKSSRPHTPHPNSHTQAEHDCIVTLIADNPNICMAELFGMLRDKYAYSRDYSGLFKYIKKNDLFGLKGSKEYVKYKPKPYDTPFMFGCKMQTDVKYVPTECLVGKALQEFRQDGTRFYQFTMIDEADREVFRWWYNEKSGYSCADFYRRAFAFYGYIPKAVQHDNGTEFRNPKGTSSDKEHIAAAVLRELGIEDIHIQPYTPRHNGKVERMHRNDQARFYNLNTFSSLEDLIEKGIAYNKRSNNIPSSVLRSIDGKKKWMTPNQKRQELIAYLKWQKELQGNQEIKLLTCGNI